jgi:hypothetical protein
MFRCPELRMVVLAQAKLWNCDAPRRASQSYTSEGPGDPTCFTYSSLEGYAQGTGEKSIQYLFNE